MKQPAPLELTKWELAEQYGWTFEYINSLTIEQVHEYYQIKDAKIKASKR